MARSQKRIMLLEAAEISRQLYGFDLATHSTHHSRRVSNRNAERRQEAAWGYRESRMWRQWEATRKEWEDAALRGLQEILLAKR